jgi:16S rRNA (guanine(966)-N(2))-methyltransferase RsmD
VTRQQRSKGEVNFVRVISGQAKGRKLYSVPGDRTRPITDRVKQALFDILVGQVAGARFLDLFAGTGSVGIEALSRGAERAVFVERSAAAVRVIHRNLRVTQLAGGAEVVREDVFDVLARPNSWEAPFHLIYVAPPQYRGLWAETLRALDAQPARWLSPDGLIVVQIFPKEYQPLGLEHFSLADRRDYGSTTLCFYEWLPPDNE